MVFSTAADQGSVAQRHNGMESQIEIFEGYPKMVRVRIPYLLLKEHTHFPFIFA